MDVMNIDHGLGEMLYNKSIFRLDRELYFNLDKQFEIIKYQVVDKMQRLRMKASCQHRL